MNYKSYIASPYVYFSDKDENGVLVNNLLIRNKIKLEKSFINLYNDCETILDYETLVLKYDEQTVTKAINAGIIIPEEEIWQMNAFDKVEIEINTDCNYRCEFCPVREEPKPRRIMSMDSYKKIIQRVVEYGRIDTVSFSVYNEPLLDPYFMERVNILKENDFKLILHTNGSLLNESMSDFLHESGIVEVIYFNFPSYEKEKFYEITRNPSYEHVCKNVDYAIKRGLNIEFSIQRTGTDYHENIKKMNDEYGDRIGKKIEAWETIDRAGTLKNKYFLGINNKGKLFGCSKFLEWLCVDVDGNCFICYNDFYDKFQYGNLIEHSIAEVAKGERYKELMQDIFGGKDADPAFICRRCKEMKYMEIYYKLSKRIRRI